MEPSENEAKLVITGISKTAKQLFNSPARYSKKEKNLECSLILLFVSLLCMLTDLMYLFSEGVIVVLQSV